MPLVHPTFNINTAEWEGRDVIAYMREVGELLPLFSQLKKMGRHPRVVLVDGVEGDFHHIPLRECACNEKDRESFIAITRGEHMDAMKTLTHDLVHIITDAKLSDCTKNLLAETGFSSFADIQRRFFSKLAVRYQDALRESFTVVGWKDDMGLGATDSREFFSVASYYYALGKGKFFNAYRDFFTAKEIEALHTFLERNIFEKSK